MAPRHNNNHQPAAGGVRRSIRLPSRAQLVRSDSGDESFNAGTIARTRGPKTVRFF